ncbi:DUF1018 domain-containing protein [Pasteurellaceae bacterium USgator11]|nr:DUF1018 domain-containing protein [Pasteurellaceae bacterium USgator41]TNG98680.1 DUF1018 domain-containing protein [Pasteurellaceae bacterium UScroc31]TNH00047.1 DUF1018 domain-containing protein [Pasteurellaceae bacterium USgator11]
MRKKLIQIVHIGKKQLGIDDESWQALLYQQFYQTSTKNVSYINLLQLVKLLQQKGAKIRLPRCANHPLTPIHRKLWATWQTMADKGLIADGSSKALENYVNRLLPETYGAWIQMSPTHVATVLETLKQWNKRIGN